MSQFNPNSTISLIQLGYCIISYCLHLMEGGKTHKTAHKHTNTSTDDLLESLVGGLVIQ